MKLAVLRGGVTEESEDFKGRLTAADWFALMEGTYDLAETCGMRCEQDFFDAQSHGHNPFKGRTLKFKEIQ